MGPPIYQIQIYQKTSLTVNHTDIAQEIGTYNWKILNVCEESQGDAPKCYKLQLIAIAFSISQN